MNSFFRFLTCLIICLSTALIASGQSFPSPNFNHKFYQPTSPEAAMLGKFGDVPVGHYTGTAGVSIPLYTIKEGGIEIPLVMQYHGSGIKVEDQASNVGLGWSMEPGGAITQIVNGTSDEEETLIGTDGYSYLKGSFTLGNEQIHRDMHGTMWDPCRISDIPGDTDQTHNALLTGDGQPDIYQFNFPGGFSGRFFKNRETNEFEVMDKGSDIKFTFLEFTSTWTAQLNNGTVYTFAAKEQATSNGGPAQQYSSRTWKLTNIAFPNNKNIRFTYRNGYNEWFFYNESYHSAYPSYISSTDYTSPYGGVTGSTTKTLDSIITSDVNIRFNMEDRHDLFGESDNDGISGNGNKSVKRVKSIDIKDVFSGRKIKTIDFAYDYFAYDPFVGGNYTTSILYEPTWDTVDSVAILGKRLKLLSLKETEYTFYETPVEIPPYQFEYDESITMPLKTSYARDHWGYYNGKNNTKLLPDLSISYYSGLLIPSSVVYAVSGADREPDSTKTGAYMLKKISYPTGGYTTFDYQTHRFSPYPTFGAGMRIANIKNYSSSGVLSDHKRIKYNNSRLRSVIQYVYKKTMYFNNNDHFRDTATVWFVASDNTIPAGAGTIVSYPSVTEESLSPLGVKNGSNVFTYWDVPPTTAYPNLPSVEESSNGKILTSGVYNTANALVNQTKYRYANIDSIATFGVKAFKNTVYYRLCDLYTHSTDFTYSYYPIWSKWTVLDSKETKQYDGANAITTLEDYSYNSKGQLVATQSNNSKGQPVVTSFLYPIDDWISATATLLRSNELYDHLLEKKIAVNGIEVSKTNLDYTMDGPQVVQTEITQSNNGGSPYTEVNFDEYGPNISLRQYTQKGLTNSLIWNDSYTQVIAEVRNAASPDIAYTGFEWNDSGTWIYPRNGLLTFPPVHSGAGNYQLYTGYTISRSGLNTGTTYLVSYWTDKGSAYTIAGTTVSRHIGTSGIWQQYEHEVTGHSSISISESGGNTHIDDLRLHPKGTHMTTYSSRPGVGMTGQTDAKGQLTTYEYEGSRLKYVKDQFGHIIKAYDYNYAH